MPQNLEVDVLKQFISQEGVDINVRTASPLAFFWCGPFLNPLLVAQIGQSKQVAIDATGVVSWRPQGLFYKKNEVYMDVLEDVNVLMSSKGD